MRGIMRSGRQSQSGMVSFLVVMILMMVITLIVLGFSQVTRRNQREALDRQLSSQAFYAAESGVNATASTIINYVKANGYSTLPSKKTCPTSYDPSSPGGVGTAIADLGSGVRYTCVLVKPDPDTLEYSPTRVSSVVVPIQANDKLKTLKFAWKMQDAGTDDTCTGPSAKWFPSAGAWNCDFAVLRVDLTANPSGNITNLPGNTATIYMTPNGSPANLTLPALGGASRANVASASNCSSGLCSVTLTLGDDISSYYARVTSIYRDVAKLIITGETASGPATFSGAQAVVDTTGQAQDELRRIQVRVQLTTTADPATLPAAALGSTSNICKRFSIVPTGSVDPLALCN